MAHKFCIPYTVRAFNACIYCKLKNNFDRNYPDFDNILKLNDYKKSNTNDDLFIYIYE